MMWKDEGYMAGGEKLVSCSLNTFRNVTKVFGHTSKAFGHASKVFNHASHVFSIHSKCSISVW